MFVRIISNTAYGDSDYSDPVNGAIIWLVPNAPHTLVNDPTVTEDTRIKISWLDGDNDGSTPIIDYSIYYDEGTGSDTYVLLDENILP